MKMITLPKLRDALRDMKYEVRVPRRSRSGRGCRSIGWSRSAEVSESWLGPLEMGRAPWSWPGSLEPSVSGSAIAEVIC